MKATASFHQPMFFDAKLPLTGTWGTTRERVIHRKPSAVRPSGLSTDEFDATKQEIVCGGILGLCALYTFAQCFIQLA